MTIKEILQKSIAKLKATSSTPHLDAEVLLSHALKKSREFILIHPEKKLTSQQLIRFNSFIKRKLRHEPVAYITEHKEFYGLDFKVNSDTLIPRPETEHLVDATLNLLRSTLHNKNTSIIDVGTGSGNIIISISKNSEQETVNNKNIHYFATDISKEALKVAKINARRHKVNKKIKFVQSNLLSYFIDHCSLLTDHCIIVANLPYLETGLENSPKSNETKGLIFEPEIALYSGKDGLNAYRKLAQQIKILIQKTKANITLICEIGHLQKKEIEKIFSFAKKIEFQKDLAKKWRLAIIKINF